MVIAFAFDIYSIFSIIIFYQRINYSYKIVI